MSQAAVVYNATPILSAFHRSTAKIRGIRGPVGSGKSTACSAEIMIRANLQAPSPVDSIRHTRFVVIRNTYRELLDSSVKTWMDWFRNSGVLNKNEMSFVGKYRDVETEILFRALDRPDDVKKLLSMELTGAWVNEAREIPKSIIDALDDRIGRYPSMRDGGCTWRGIVMDTNAPDQDHWWYKLAEEDRPEGWEFFTQPGGLVERDGKYYPNPDAENMGNLEKDYYITRLPGKKLDHVRVYYCNQYGFVVDGRPVIPEYVDAAHCSKEIIAPVKSLPILVGIDWGLTPAAAFGQRYPNGRRVVIGELVTEHMGAERFGLLFAQHINANYKGFQFDTPWGDPSGSTEVGTDERTVFQVFNESLRKQKVPLVARPAPSNDPVLRHGSLGSALGRMIDGQPGLLISPNCTYIRKGLAGGYCYKRLAVAGQDRFQDKPDKNKYSHPVEALEYQLLGDGEGRALVSASVPVDQSERVDIGFDVFKYDREPQSASFNFDVFSRGE